MFTLVQEAFDWALNRNQICLSFNKFNQLNILFHFIWPFLISSHQRYHLPSGWIIWYSPKISLLYWNLCPMLPSHLASLYTSVLDPTSWRTSASSHQVPLLLFLFYMATLASLTLSPYPPSLPIRMSLLAYHFWIHPPGDQANALSLEGENWQGSCFPISSDSWGLRCCHQRQEKKYRLN